MLSSKELADIHSEANRALPDSCQILRPSFAPDGYGGQTQTEPSVASVACRVSPAGQARGRQELLAGTLADAAGWIVNVPWGTNVQTRDIVSVVGKGQYVVQQAVTRSWGASIVLYCSTREDA